MLLIEYLSLKKQIIEKGFQEDINWTEKVGRPRNAARMTEETIWVICNSGMKYEIAKKIFDKVINAIINHNPPETVFKNKNKVRAIDNAFKEANKRYKKFMSLTDTDKILECFETFDGIGPITKYHLARNLGIDVCKPDRHLERIAKKYNTDPHSMCSKLSKESGDRIGTVDVVLWRSAVLGII